MNWGLGCGLLKLFWLPAWWASGFSGDHQQNHQCLWFHSFIMLLMYSVLHCLYSVTNQITTTTVHQFLHYRNFQSCRSICCILWITFIFGRCWVCKLWSHLSNMKVIFSRSSIFWSFWKTEKMTEWKKWVSNPHPWRKWLSFCRWHFLVHPFNFV